MYNTFSQFTYPSKSLSNSYNLLFTRHVTHKLARYKIIIIRNRSRKFYSSLQEALLTLISLLRSVGCRFRLHNKIFVMRFCKSFFTRGVSTEALIFEKKYSEMPSDIFLRPLLTTTGSCLGGRDSLITSFNVACAALYLNERLLRPPPFIHNERDGVHRQQWSIPNSPFQCPINAMIETIVIMPNKKVLPPLCSEIRCSI